MKGHSVPRSGVLLKSSLVFVHLMPGFQIGDGAGLASPSSCSKDGEPKGWVPETQRRESTGWKEGTDRVWPGEGRGEGGAGRRAQSGTGTVRCPVGCRTAWIQGPQHGSGGHVDPSYSQAASPSPVASLPRMAPNLQVTMKFKGHMSPPSLTPPCSSGSGWWV